MWDSTDIASDPEWGVAGSDEGPNASRSEEDGESDLMVSMPIKPFVIPVVVEARR